MIYTNWNKIWESCKNQSLPMRTLYLFAEYTNTEIPNQPKVPSFFHQKPAQERDLQLARYLFASRIYDAIEPFIDGHIQPMNPLFSVHHILAQIKAKIGIARLPVESELFMLLKTIREKSGVDFWQLDKVSQQEQQTAELSY